MKSLRFSSRRSKKTFHPLKEPLGKAPRVGSGARTTIERVSAIESALNRLLEEILANEARKRADGPIEFKLVSFAAIDAAAMPTRAESAISDMAKDPVGAACRLGVRHCGEMLFQIGGVDLMHEVIDRVADQNPAKFGARGTIMDHAWNGIGDVWWS